MFAAGYGSALVEGADHREAFKSGTLLSAMHFTNALGTRAGKLAFAAGAKLYEMKAQIHKKCPNSQKILKFT